jgi:hypothetical protein
LSSTFAFFNFFGGKFTISGRVVDERGNGVADVELQVGQQTVYTGATGEFELTVGRVVTPPAEVTPGEPVVIVVSRMASANPK